ncbi:MAG TPA: chemotaxis protein CheW [Nitrospiraceae bacterium]|jgi:chemotaxis signal transduction protein|nr:chemotaxis protein CheW [Nitrospiraceae bacterium]
MPTTLPGLRFRKAAQGSTKAKSVMLLVFSVGGRRMAARASDVGGIWPWTDVVSIPSGTPHISAVLKRGEDILPVFDLAGRLSVQVTGAALCLIAKRKDGLMAVCIDGDIPTLQSVSEESIRRVAWKDSDVIGTCRIEAEELPVYSLAHLGLNAMRSLDGESGGSYAKSSRS